MKTTFQMEGMNILQHGEMVRDYFNDLIDHLENGASFKYDWRLPDWLVENKTLILERLLDRRTCELYQIYHDCGKPYCIEFDDQGRRHFPNHATMSYLTWQRHSADRQIAQLIWDDMLIHTIKADAVPEFAKKKEAATLLLTGLAEIHANAAMFGGIESTSFKIKYKQIDKRGKAIINEWLK